MCALARASLSRGIAPPRPHRVEVEVGLPAQRAGVRGPAEVEREKRSALSKQTGKRKRA